MSHRLSKIIQCSYSFSIFCTFLLWLLRSFLLKANLHSRYRLLHKQCFIILSDFFIHWFAMQHIYSAFSLSNISFKHSSSQLRRLKSDMDSTFDFCYFWYCCIFNNALVLHSLLCLLCFFSNAKCPCTNSLWVTRLYNIVHYVPCMLSYRWTHSHAECFSFFLWRLFDTSYVKKTLQVSMSGHGILNTQTVLVKTCFFNWFLCPLLFFHTACMFQQNAIK